MSKHQTQFGRVRRTSQRGVGQSSSPHETKTFGARKGKNWGVTVKNIYERVYQKLEARRQDGIVRSTTTNSCVRNSDRAVVTDCL